MGCTVDPDGSFANGVADLIRREDANREESRRARVGSGKAAQSLTAREVTADGRSRSNTNTVGDQEEIMPRRFVVARKAGTVVAAAIGGIVVLTPVASGQPTIRPGVGGGYTFAPNNAGESPGGDWNVEGFLLVGLRGTPVQLRPTGFSYGRGSSATVGIDCPAMSCPLEYLNGSGAERATGLALDMVIPLTHGPLVPYLVAGPAGVFVSRQTSPRLSAAHSAGLGYELGGGARAAVGRMVVFAEVKYFGTDATENQFSGHSVHMVPLTAGITF